FLALPSNGFLPLIASTVDTELAKPIWALPDSTAFTLAMPAPGSTCTVSPFTFFSTMFLMAPPSGYQDPPWGPVIRRMSAAEATETAPATVNALDTPSASLKIDFIDFFPIIVAWPWPASGRSLAPRTDQAARAGQV